jgi:hypothetical protein
LFRIHGGLKFDYSPATRCYTFLIPGLGFERRSTALIHEQRE